jgi:hypothetical protein
VADTDDKATIIAIREHADRILASGALGRSRFYKGLLEFLVTCVDQSRTPKEIEIAAEVFKRGADFDPGQDSMVRVYAHNLRLKLHQYYQEAGRGETKQLTILKGEYRLALSSRDAATGRALLEAPPPANRIDIGKSGRVAALVLLGVIGGLVMSRFLGPPASPAASTYREVAASPYWSAMLSDDRPIVIVVGDYYIFGELDERGNVDRLVREFSINSSRDLDELLMLDPEFIGRYIDLDLTYLPSSTAFAIREFLRIVYTTDKPVRVVSMSNIDAMDIRDNHVIYVGYISALDKLIDFVFSASELAIGRTFDELVNTITGDSFQSEAGIPTEQRNYRDYGLVSVFPGPNGNKFMILAGTRDEGLMQSAQSVSDPTYVAASISAVAGQLGATPPAFEILYEVAGFDRANLDAAIVHVAEINYEAIWAGELALPD